MGQFFNQKSMKQFTLTLAVVLLSLFSFSDNWTPIKTDTPSQLSYKVISSDETSIVVSFSTSGFNSTNVITPKGKAAIISVPKMVSLSEKGAPDLPKYAVSAIIGDNDLMDVRVLSSEYTDFPNVDVAPSKGDFSRQIDPATVPYTYGPVYQQDAFYPSTTVDLQEPYILRNFRGQALTVMPFSYNPVNRTLRVFHELKVEIYKNGTGGANTLSRSATNSKEDFEFEHLYQNHFINYANVHGRYPVLQEQGPMLVIAAEQFMNDMQPFIEWKKTIGRPIEMVNVSTIGTTPTAIKDYVQNYYNTKGLTHLLIVGDHQHVPSYNNTASGGYSDNYYGYLAGNDSYNEVFVGRFSVETAAHVQTMVQRVITYERDLDQTATWLGIGTGIARNEGAGGGHNGGEADYVHMDYIRDSLLHYTYSTVHREYDGSVPGLPNTNATQISARINEGTSIINYCNHGSQNSWSVGGYSSSHVDNLSNTDRWPIIWAVACDNGKFTNGTCFAESWTRASKNGQPTGAIGTMMSWISQPWTPPMTGQDEMVTILVEGFQNNIKRTFGGTSINGSMKMIDLHGSSGKSTHDTWILFGDPSLTLRTKAPDPVIVSHLPTIFLGMTEFTVNANAEGATVALSVNGESIGTAAISNGSATITFPALNDVGTLKIAVFGFNKVTYIGEIEIVPASGPFIAYVSNTVNGSAGGQVYYGTTANLGVQLRNLGVENASNVLATLSTESEYVTITDNTESFGTIAPDQVVTMENAFTISVANNVPNNTSVPFTLTITANEGNWSSNFNLMALAPSFSIGNFVVNDVSGNNNGRLDPGETVDLKVSITNEGLAQATNALANINFFSPYITVNTASYQAATVDAGQAIEALFNISVSGSTPIGQAVPFTVNVAAGAYEAQKSFTAKVGLILEDFETGDFNAFNWTTGGNLPWTITMAGAYEGSFAAKSGAITNSQSTQLILQYEVSAADSISFFRKVSSESGYDKMQFFIDAAKVGEWSGDVPWSRVAYAVTAGSRTFKWVYMKDVSVASGSDCAWIDYVTFPPMLITSGWAGNNAEICAGSTYQPDATAAQYNSLNWTTTGDGTFSNAGILNPVYTPGNQDIAGGSVQLKLTVVGNSSTVESSMTLTIHGNPEVFVGQDLQICNGSAIELSSATAIEYSSLNWTSSGDGSFNDATLLHPIYTPGQADLASGSAMLTLTAGGIGGCQPSAHTAGLTINPLPTVTISGDQTVCEGQPATVVFTLTGSAPWKVSLVGETDEMTIPESPWSVQTTPYSSTIIALSGVSDANNCANTASGQVEITLNAVPEVPAQPVAPESVDHAYDSQSNVSVAALANTTSYQWAIEPAEAGTIAGNGIEAVVSWTIDYLGIAHIKVAGLNECGQGAWSPASEVTVHSTIGLSESRLSSLKVYPNPSVGRFTLVLPMPVIKGAVKVTNTLGELVYSESLHNLNAGTKELNLSALPNGVYVISLTSDEKISMQRVAIQK